MKQIDKEAPRSLDAEIGQVDGTKQYLGLNIYFHETAMAELH